MLYKKLFDLTFHNWFSSKKIDQWYQVLFWLTPTSNNTFEYIKICFIVIQAELTDNQTKINTKFMVKWDV